ncbi:diaminopimelate epimerase [uncultured Brevundimonas sp.]|uniref:diaminopimelate epimerase n=1 Tax=uncultured Brevundimonas sp. TaxID=213418 RepID=UPI00260AAC94|nr:diaminopimelate epimerase [uncultured Brevundimonas sp.]
MNGNFGSAEATWDYVRMNGAGNAFIVVDAFDHPFRPSEDEVRRLASPEAGLGGFDQLISVERASGADGFMRVWNADGSMVETCGNALRCVGWLMMEEFETAEVSIDTLGGLARASRAGDLRVRVDMGEPRLEWQQIPLAEEMDTRGIELQVGPIDDPVVHTPGAVSMGNPHVVFFTDRQDDVFVRGTGSLVEHHPLFPEGINVGFAHVLDRSTIRLRVWERGAGLTLACGTGACAAMVAAHRRGLIDRSATMILDGGELVVEWDAQSNHVFMTGPVEIERTGTLNSVL